MTTETLHFDPAHQVLLKGNDYETRLIHLTPTESRILALLAKAAPDSVRSRDLLKAIGHHDWETTDLVRAHIRNIRRKLGERSPDFRYIRNVGRGAHAVANIVLASALPEATA